MTALESGITSRGQTTLPKAVRQALSVGAGDRVRYIIDGDTVRIVPVRTVNRLFGILRYDGPAVSLEEMDRAVAAGASRAEKGLDA
ncbi:MAG: AbrB/MazE/SpoVT family DNA-binding domain-containing protein [Gemmatimonadota bacterium]|nr:AbrB/MazE/SpoVT family DNA-binding domain-containing protein [Acidimicrobiaceae bacterium]MDE2877040.1 AbrB/MazE/SpoVT family DNA-binding domain-containing protein [Gemmatimonadota bacterium]